MKSALRSLLAHALLAHFAVLPLGAQETQAAQQTYDLVVYGGTSAGVIAALQAQRMGKRAIIVCPDAHLGGLSAGGLGWTDSGNKQVIGGLARSF